MKRKIDDANGAEAGGPRKKSAISDDEARGHFRPGLFKISTLGSFTEDYSSSQPYKHGVISDLLDPLLLRNVRDEIRSNISFTPKETDIYKIHQSGDLANLDGLDDDSLKLLPSLVTLRDALYSAPFREYLSHITGSGPLSGSKTDMAVNVYTPTCHLLCHDDVIGSRRVSYILYLTDPDRPWKPEWGGALRLYPTRPVKPGSDIKLPSSNWSHSIPPAFNQLSFFAVQPGESFHDVEEVYAAAKGTENNEDDGGRIRMAISGWYHIPQPGEHGYEEGAEARQAEKSSLAQLQGNATEYDQPQPRWIPHNESIPGETAAAIRDDSTELTEADLNLLLRFMNPRYLTPETVEELAENFGSDASLRLGMFFSDTFANALRAQIEALDTRPDMGTGRWSTACPPHKHRYRYIQANPASSRTDPLHEAINVLFPSLAFRKWLALATDLTLDDCDVLARRFMRGLDYTLATAYEQREPQLEMCVGTTPSRGWAPDEEEENEEVEDDEVEGDAEAMTGLAAADGEAADSSNAAKVATQANGANGDTERPENAGGYEVYMAGDDDDDDDDDDDGEEDAGDEGADSGYGVKVSSTHTGAGQRGSKRKKKANKEADPAVYGAGGEGEDDGILLSLPPSWNTLSVVLRDRGTLRFVKYVSRSAPGDRWDIFGVWKVEEDFDDDDEDDAEEDD